MFSFAADTWAQLSDAEEDFFFCCALCCRLIEATKTKKQLTVVPTYQSFMLFFGVLFSLLEGLLNINVLKIECSSV